MVTVAHRRAFKDAVAKGGRLRRVEAYYWGGQWQSELFYAYAVHGHADAVVGGAALKWVVQRRRVMCHLRIVSSEFAPISASVLACCGGSTWSLHVHALQRCNTFLHTVCACRSASSHSFVPARRLVPHRSARSLTQQQLGWPSGCTLMA